MSAPGELGALADPERLRALRATELLDTLPREAFDRFTRLATLALGSPVSLVTLVDVDRQVFVSQQGLAEPWASARQTPLSHSFCQHVVRENAPLVVTDAREDPRVQGNGAITDLDVVAYAGVPLTTADGHTLGSFCAIDGRPRTWSAGDLDALRDIAAMVISEIALRTALRESEEARSRLEDAARSIRTMHGVLDAADAEGAEARGEALRVAADLAHELRTPLYAIRMLAEDIAEEAPPTLHEHLGSIETTTAEALAVIDHQLELAKDLAGRSTVRVGATQVPQLLQALRGMLEPLPRPAGVALVFEAAEELPVLRTDGLKLAQILRNLTTNALRHTEAGEVRVTAAPAAATGWVSFTVADTGIGIAPEDHERVFGRFEQVLGAAQAGGTGLGLPLARRMARMLGGDITLDSAKGEGSRFELTIPMELREPAPGVRVAPAPY